MTDWIRSLFKKYKQKGILVDTNILLLWFVGTVNRNRISTFKRTQQFIPEDYDTLMGILAFFNQIVTTPNILTEVNSLINQLGEPERAQCLLIFGEALAGLTEVYLESSRIATIETFTKFGLTDSGIIDVAPNQYLVLTDDFRLSQYLQKVGIETLNFNNIRPLGWI